MIRDEWPRLTGMHGNITPLSRLKASMQVMPFRINNQTEYISQCVIRFNAKIVIHENPSCKVLYKIGGGMEMLRSKMDKLELTIDSIKVSGDKVESKLQLIRFYKNQKDYENDIVSAQWLPWDSSYVFDNGKVFPEFPMESNHDFNFIITKHSIITMYVLPNEKLDLTFCISDVKELADTNKKTFTEWLK